jgi:hypothetical protein
VWRVCAWRGDRVWGAARRDGYARPERRWGRSRHSTVHPRASQPGRPGTWCQAPSGPGSNPNGARRQPHRPQTMALPWGTWTATASTADRFGGAGAGLLDTTTREESSLFADSWREGSVALRSRSGQRRDPRMPSRIPQRRTVLRGWRWRVSGIGPDVAAQMARNRRFRPSGAQTVSTLDFRLAFYSGRSGGQVPITCRRIANSPMW